MTRVVLGARPLEPLVLPAAIAGAAAALAGVLALRDPDLWLGLLLSLLLPAATSRWRRLTRRPSAPRSWVLPEDRP